MSRIRPALMIFMSTATNDMRRTVRTPMTCLMLSMEASVYHDWSCHDDLFRRSSRFLGVHGIVTILFEDSWDHFELACFKSLMDDFFLRDGDCGNNGCSSLLCC